jgi:uncharacterized protein (DUF1810 family)
MIENLARQSDGADLRRFADVQLPLYEIVLAELNAGRKRTHWIWFIFPQVEGLGKSIMAMQYAIRSHSEGRAYLEHPVLGVRLLECTEAVLRHQDRTAHEIFGSPDDLKLQSSMTLFAQIGGGPSFEAAIDSFYDGQPDKATLSILSQWKQRPAS